MSEQVWMLEDARLVAGVVLHWLGDACERIEIAGSVRREKETVKDLEIVYMPKLVMGQATLFGDAARVPATEERIMTLVRERKLMWDELTPRRGEKYQRLIHVSTGMVVELFRADMDNWGAIMMIRTGPADYAKMLVSHSWHNGVMPVDMAQRDGYLWRHGVRVSVPTEVDYCNEIGVPWWAPRDRHAGRLAMWAKSQATVALFE